MLKQNWQTAEIAELFALPLTDLLHRAHCTHREHFPANEVQLSALLSIKTGACPEDCAYCSQSGHYKTGITQEKLLDCAAIVSHARQAKAAGASRYCMGAAWRNLPEKHVADIVKIIGEVKALGLETCMTLGMLTADQAQQLQAAGLDFYSHNLDTSPEYYKKIITTRTYQDRLDTLEHVRHAGMKTCCGGIVGMGETRDDPIEFLRQLANLPQQPLSVPINLLIAIKGTPLSETPPLDVFEYVRMIAVARIMLPKTYVRLGAGREKMTDECQALCFYAGANSIFYGETLLTATNPAIVADQELFQRLGLQAKILVTDECYV